MENLKVKVSNEAESKEAQELFFELGYMVVNNMDCEKGYIVASKNAESPINFDYWHDVKNIVTTAQLRDMAVLKRNDVGDATHINFRTNTPYLVQGDKEYYIHKKRWFLSDCPNDLTPIEKPMTETEYLMQGKNGERLMESVRQVKASQWDMQVGGDHYKTMKIQPAQFALENKLDYCQANAIKYICRHQSKNGKQDLEKAKHYIDLLIEHYYGGEI